MKIKSVSNSAHLILCGDFNSRTSDMPDFVTNDVYLDYLPLPDDYEIDVNLPRFSQDNCVNNNGSLLIDMCIQSGLRILNGRIGNDNGIGKCTYIGSRGSSLIDYVLTMPDCMQMFNIFKVEDPNVLSDHCVIYFEYEYTLNTNSINSTTCNEE